MPSDRRSQKDEPQAQEQRRDDRRESPRLPIKVWVKNSTSSRFEALEGDISVGGLHFTGTSPIVGKQVDLRFKLPGREQEVLVHGEVVEVSEHNGLHGAHIRFGDMDVDTELAIARFIDERT
jgi:hypothetical protein